MGGLYDAGRKFDLKQRIAELEQTLEHFPNSDRNYARREELERLKDEYEKYKD